MIHRLPGCFLFLFIFLAPFCASLTAQNYGLEVETVSDDIGVLVGALGATDLTGYACYRAYITMENEDDFLSSISGDSSNPTYVTTTTSFYQAVLGGPTPNGINALLFPVYPDLAYDSWVSIGLEGVPSAVAGEANVSTVQSSTNLWTTNFDPGGGMDGGSIIIDDLIGGAWYALYDHANGVAGTDLKVLAGQFTTDGTLSLQLYTQIFINGNGLNEVLVDGERPTYIWPTWAVQGCTDETACNYNPDAGIDDGSCTYPAESYLDCDGNCYNDEDGDGLCDEEEGCSDPEACNYNPNATDDDGSCEYVSCLGCTDSMACNYDPNATLDDGTCDYSCIGCTDMGACNYDAAATVDSGDCTYPAASYVDCDGNCYNDEDGDGLCDEEEGCSDPEACNYDPTAVTIEADYCLIVDTVAVHTTGDLAGMTTYRYYVKCLNPADFVSSVSGDATNPTVVTTTTDFYHDELGGWTPNGITPFLFGAFPNLQYDSWVTIGLDSQPDVAAGEANVSTVQATANPWLSNFDPGFGIPGGNIVINDAVGGSWFVLNGDANGIAANSPDQQVLIAQLTTSGEVEGNFYVQIFENGAGANAFFLDFNIGDACIAPDDACLYPADVYGSDVVDCEGNCLNDSDADGICDEAEVVGCTDPEACNYDETATDAGACTYPFDLYGSPCVDCAGDPVGGWSDSGDSGYGLEVEVVADDIGMLTGALGVTDLTGYSCYRLYVTMNNSDDFMSSVSGDINNPTYINTTTDYYHAILGGGTPNGIQSLLFPLYPDLAYDTWITIGLEGIPDPVVGEASVSTVQSSTNPWFTNFDPGGGAPGASIEIDDLIGGAWYALNGDANGVAGDDLKVLIGQFTTTGELSGQAYCSVFINGDGMTELRDTFYFDTSNGVSGCTDPEACNHVECADMDDGSCEYPESGLDCDGNCVDDADSDGVCDADEIEGCQDPEACNFMPEATDEDGSCQYPMDVFGVDYVDCEGNCLPNFDGGGSVGGYGLEVEVISEDIGMLVGALGTTDLTGYSCYRAYITMENEDDFLSSISGDASNPTYVTSTGTFYHAVLGAVTPNGINSLLFPVYPDLEYDSWVTIGLEGTPNAVAGEANVSTVQSYGNPWSTTFDPGGGVAGTSIMIDDPIGGAWYALNGDANGVAGLDLKVLAGQFTTQGEMSFQLYTQVFINGNGLNEVEGPNGGQRPTFTWPTAEVREGCTDEAACNFQPCANEEDGSCVYPVDLFGADYLDCDGGCLNDADGDGLCDEEELCGDPMACNFDPDGLEELESTPFCLVLDTVAVHTSGELEGMTTYRLYLSCSDPGDFVSAVGGYDAYPVYLNTTTTFYQNAIGGPTANGINPLLFAAFPELMYDSWVTIGLEETADAVAGEGAINTVQGPNNPWLTNFDPGQGLPGSSIVIDDPVGGAWFALIGDENAIAGNHPDQQVLLAQLTTDGVISGQLYIQVFAEGNQNDIEEFTLEIGASCLEDDPDCLYPVDFYGIDYVDCDENCLNDADLDGICDEDEIPGCTDENSCSYEPEATDDDGSCSYLSLDIETTDVSCFGLEDGTLSLVFTEGVSPFELTIGGLPSLELHADSFFFESVAPGVYTVFVTDAAGCQTEIVAFEIGEPDPLSFSIGIDGECAPPGGLAVSTYAYGGTPPYSFVATGNTPVSVTSGSMGPGPDVFLMPDDWLINAVDDNGCVSDTVYFSLPPCTGCNDELACNFDPQALEDDGSCTYPLESYLDCAGNCLNDTDGDGVCDEIEVPGCTWQYACNYNPEATDENGSCYLASVFFDCDGNCQLDLNDNGVCDFYEDFTSGTSYCGPGTAWDPEAGACIPYDNCPSDINEDGYIGVPDLLDLLSDYDTSCD